MHKYLVALLLLCISNLSAEIQWEEYVSSELEERIKARCLEIESGELLAASGYSPMESLKECNKLGLPEAFSLIPLALSPATEYDTRLGDWALSAPIARYYHLKIDRYYDERMDKKKATLAALHYLQSLQKEYKNDWLCFLAFSHSPALVNSYLEIHGKNMVSVTDFYDSGYFDRNKIVRYAALLALGENIYHEDAEQNDNKNNASRYISEDDIYSSILLGETGLKLDTFAMLNPCLRFEDKLIPKGYPINLPDSTYGIALDSVYSKSRYLSDSLTLAKLEVEKARELARKRELEAKRYKVKSGDTLGHIALRYGVSVKALKKWNSLRSDMLQIGQTIKIYN